ncbi:uncharacterized protein LOC122059570 [Macadamia integrifolia]|uniref:uncharacterized protein LOC122059570 n=1 Tax=Macadamia integrifolia TaxID=60698 RepID=UPI001C529395|nr:uncharacterized protein LOC122059570 [Macadamia integrifolia]
MSSFNNNNNIDSLLLQTLMGRLQLRPPYLHTNSYLSQNLEDFLLDTNAIPDDDGDDNDSDRTPLAKEESKLEKEIIRIILGGNTESLKPNSGQAVSIGEHHVCVGFHEEKGSDYRVWEWHGHIMLFDEENGYSPEYIYGNYFERVPSVKRTPDDEKEEEKDAEKEERVGSLGLRELIGGGDSVGGRILHRNMNSGSRRF